MYLEALKLFFGMTEDFGVEVNSETINVWTYFIMGDLTRQTYSNFEDMSEFVLAVLLDYQQSSGLAWAYEWLI